jgi:two-component system, NarL family, sensor kinase
MKKYCFIHMLFFLVIASEAQQHAADSLGRIVDKLPDDTTKVIQLNQLVVALQYSDPAEAASRAEQSIQLAGKLRYTLGLATAYRLRGVLYVDRAILDSGKIFYDKAFALVKGRKEHLLRKQEGMLTHNYGVIFHHKQQYDSATANYLAAANIYREINQEGLLFFPYINLTSMYSFLKDNHKAMRYAKEAYAAAVKMNDPGKLLVAINSEISIRMELGQYDSVLLPLQQNILRARTLQNHYAEGKANNLIAQYYGDGRNKYDSAVYFRKKALRAMEKIDNQYEIAGMLQNIGYDYKQIGDYDSALVYLKKATALATSLGLDQVVHYSISNLAEVEEKRGNYKAAYRYLTEFVVVNDSLQARNNRSQVYELETKYQTARKELQIKQLEADKALQQLSISRKNILNYILIGSGVTMLIISFLFYRNYKQKQKLQQQRITELETEKQLAATAAVLKGEEQERTRLARDLHDGLGGMLSGIKYSFNMMKGNLIMTPENQQAFGRSMDMLDSSIMEMRRVAHNMMPEALVRFGLDVALKDYCNDINTSGALQVRYQSIGLENEIIDQTIAITIYRIIQELISNTLKHAMAATAIVQVTKTDRHFSVTVEDDGRGFDPVAIKQSKSIGWANIQHRINFLKGKLDIDSAPGKGTSVHIEFDIK